MFNRLTDSFRCSAYPTRRRKSRQPVLNLEPLEDRRFLATFTVTSISDGPVTATGDLSGSLRQAIFDANANPGADVIEFDESVFSGGDSSLLRLTSGELEVTDSLTIDGSTGVDVAISGDANGNDVVLAGGITDVDASGADLLDDNSRVLNFSSETGNLTLSAVTITGGRTVGDGAGIRAASNGVVSLSDSIVSGNSTEGGRGGGVFLEGSGSTLDNFGGELKLLNSTVSQNKAEGGGYFEGGGGIATGYGSVLTVADTTVSDNSATRSGGGIFSNYGMVTINNSTVSGNSADFDGGGIHLYGLGILPSGGFDPPVRNSLTLTNSTISGNSSGISFSGLSSPDLTLINSTITGNTRLGVYANGYFDPVSLTVRNSIVAGNGGNEGIPSDLITGDYVNNVYGTSGTTGTINHSLIGNADQVTVTGTGNLTGTAANPLDPELGPLTDNGGPTLTHALLPDSPAINAGDNSLAVDADGNPLLTDQRGDGFDRIQSGTVDLGATEVVPVPPVVTNIVRDEGGVLDRLDLISSFAVTFDLDVSVARDDLLIFNGAPNDTDTSGLAFDYDSASRTATWSFDSVELDPAVYTFKLSSDITSVGGGLPLGPVEPLAVYVALPGDANLDTRVDVLDDAFALVENLRTTGGATWAQGDFNGDGNVDVLGDAFILVGRLGQSVVPPAPALALSAVGQTSQLALVDQGATQSVVLVDLGGNLLDEQESELRSVNPISSAAELSLAGSQNVDAAFESNRLFDFGLI